MPQNQDPIPIHPLHLKPEASVYRHLESQINVIMRTLEEPQPAQAREFLQGQLYALRSAKAYLDLHFF